MKNLWIQTEHPFATWVADMDALRDEPAKLLELVKCVLGFGEKHKVFQVVEAPTLQFRLAPGQDLSGKLDALYRDQQLVDLFSFTGAAMAPRAPGSSTARATLSWFDESDQQVEGECEDLGSLLENLEPVEDSIPRGFRKHYPPVRITGPKLVCAGDPPKIQNLPSGRPVAVRVAIHSDIWFPWVFGSAHPLCDHQRMFDNRALALQHTPRLNAFLQDVARCTKALGGSWQVDVEETGNAARQWVDEDGIRLDAAPPAAVMPTSALDAEWF